MVRILGLLEVDSTSPSQGTPFPTETRRVGRHTLLEWLVRRVSEATLVDQVAVVTCDEQHAEALRSIAPASVPVFHVRGADTLERAVAVLNQLQADAIVRVRIEQPLVDPTFIDQLITSAQGAGTCDYATYAMSRPDTLASHVGVFTDWFRGTALRRAHADAKTDSDRAELAAYIMQHPETFQLRLVSAPQELDRNDLRLTMTTADDWEHFHTICDALGPEALDWQRISGLLDLHPEMRQRMAELNAHQCAT